MSPKRIPLHLLHLSINAIQMVTLFTFTAFNILDIHDKACSCRSTLTFPTCVCVCVLSHTRLQPSTWNTGCCIKRFNQSPLKKISIFQGFPCSVLVYQGIYIQLTLGFRCELKWSLKWQISQSLESNGNDISSAPCQIHIKSAQMDCTSGHDQEYRIRCKHAASPAAHFFVEIKQVQLHSRNVSQSSDYTSGHMFPGVPVRRAATDGRFVWSGSREMTPTRSTCPRIDLLSVFCLWVDLAVTRLPCSLGSPFTPAQRGTHDLPDPLCHRRIN